MATSSIAPPLLRPFMLLISICTTVLNLTACETDSTESASTQSASVQSAAALSDLGLTISENATAAADSSITLNRSASAMSMRKCRQVSISLVVVRQISPELLPKLACLVMRRGRWYKVSTTVCTLMLLLSAKRTKIRANASSMYQQIWALCLPR